MLPAMKIPTTLAQQCALKRLPTTITDGTIKKPLSISASHSKRFVINDHYEFDQKVNHLFFSFYSTSSALDFKWHRTI